MGDVLVEVKQTVLKRASERGRAPVAGHPPGSPAFARPLDRPTASLRKLTHVDDHGRARMVDVSNKPATVRQAVARGEVRMTPQTLGKIQTNGIAKGDVLAGARIAGVMAAQRADERIPPPPPPGPH